MSIPTATSQGCFEPPVMNELTISADNRFFALTNTENTTYTATITLSEDNTVNKSAFYFLCAAIGLSIIILGLIALPESDLTLSPQLLIKVAVLGCIALYICLNRVAREKIKHLFCDYDWAEEAVAFYNAIPKVYRKSFWYLFGFINLAFLFHTINFMWGNQDWAAVRSSVDISEGVADGRFSAYWLQELIFDGKILPVINNLISFAALSLSTVLLGIYWQLPKKSTFFIIIGLFMFITPYTLSWLYFAKNTLGNLAIPALVLGALLLSEHRMDNIYKTYFHNLIAILLFTIALGTCFSAINFISVAILGKIFLKTVFADIHLKDAFKRLMQTFANLTAALLIYIFITVLLNEKAMLTPLSEIITSLPTTLAGVLTQFTEVVPFTNITYKLLYLIIVLTSLFALILKAPNAQAAARGLITLPLILIATRLSLILTAETSNSVMRAEFYGLPLFYALMATAIFKLGGDYLKRFGGVLCILAIFMGFVRVSYAQKVWKFGFDAEFKLAERIITRLEKLPEFNIEHKYSLLQLGEASLRPRFYIHNANETMSNELLSWAYYPEGHAKDAYNFYYQADFLEDDADIATALQNPAIKDYILNTARAWPAQESLFIHDKYIVIVIDNAGLQKAQKALAR